MKSFFSQFKRLGWTLLLISIIIISAFYYALKPMPVLPIYQPAMITPELVDDDQQHIKKFHTIADFQLQNQNNQTITLNQVNGQIHVADFFFTTCPTICPIMTDNMRFLQDKLKSENVQLLSFSVTPEIDSVPQLKKYALQKGVNDAQWNLLTGPKNEIYALARKSYMVVKNDGDGGPFDMIHTENFVLVDPQKRIRGYYDGTSLKAMEQLLKDIKILQNEISSQN